MSEPEISRRCLSCGASVRQQALFCPQCGNGMSHQGPVTNAVDAPTLDLSAKAATIESPNTVEQSPADLKTAPLNVVGATATEKPLPNRQGTRPLDGNVAPTEREYGVLGRVEKLRKASSVVIDQAAYDPSLRFLLVAGVLFLLFLLLLILSKVIS